MQLWREYEAREKAIRDEKSHLLTAIQEGEEKGIAQGRAEEKHAVACNFLKLGLDCKTVAAGTGLSLEEVEALSKELKA